MKPQLHLYINLGLLMDQHVRGKNLQSQVGDADTDKELVCDGKEDPGHDLEYGIRKRDCTLSMEVGTETKV